ncbi:MAG TPA: hypothetical protein VMO17_22820 [Terriglobia bacterium]|nr:hypothetical protein [Terriglobia bacterium]
MQKGENIVSIALAVVVLLAVIAIQRRWNPASLQRVASSAEEFILTTTGIGGQVPDIAGYERLKDFRLGNYRAGLYRATPAPLIFAPGRLVIYDESNHPVFKLETLEGSKESWSALYDFSGRHGITVPGSRARASYTRDLAGDGVPDVIVGQYSGGSHCCTVATILELRKDAVVPIGRIDGIDGLPFEGFDVRKLTRAANWQCIAHRPFVTACGTHSDAADVLAVYAFTGDHFQDETMNFGDYLQEVLRQDLGKWRQERNRSMDLLQTVAVDYAVVGQKDAGKRFFALNLSQLIPSLRSHNVDPNTCQEALEELVDRVPAAEPEQAAGIGR